MAYIEKWIAEGAGREVRIHDPYLTPSDVVEILKMVLSVKPSLEVNIITSKKGLQNAHVSSPYSDHFRASWSEASSQSAPITRVVIVSVGPEGAGLVHDRWWCSGDSGLEFGTSFNGLGKEKVSKIRIMPREEAAQAAARLREIAGMRVRYVEEKRVVYESVDL